MGNMVNNAKECISLRIQRSHTEWKAVLEKNQKIYAPVINQGSKSRKSNKPKVSIQKVKLAAQTPKKKALPKSMLKKACLALCSFPDCVENAEAAAFLLLLTLLSQVAHLLIGITPAMPTVYLDCAPLAAVPVLHAMLEAIQGPEVWQGNGWKLHRPHIIRPHCSLLETKPSLLTRDYIGGTFEDDFGKKRRFCFPIISSAMALLPGVPLTVAQDILRISPLALPLVFERSRAVSARPSLELKKAGFDSYDVEKVETLSNAATDCYWEVELFLKWFCEKKKHFRHWQDAIDRFRPVTRKGRFTTPKSDDRTEWLCAGLALFQQYLYFASEKAGWITEDEAHDFLLQYWRLVLPESAPYEENGQAAPENLAYDAPDVFYQFLSDAYLPTYRSQIVQGVKGESGTMGLIRELDGGRSFIAPRKIILEAYTTWLAEHRGSVCDLSAPKSEAAVQRQLMENGVPLRGEKHNPSTWRYSFYREDNGKVECFALPFVQLPESVRSVFGELFGIDSDCGEKPKAPEAAPNSSEVVKWP